MRLLGHVELNCTLTCETGLHIGDEGALEIGGVDGPVVKEPTEGYPYVPGSSLKGKMRSLLEWHEGKVDSEGDTHECGDADAVSCPICRVFGTPADIDANTGPTRLSVRDAFPTEETKIRWEEEFDTVLPYTEIKTENSINRITAAANVRSNERVPKDSEFDCEFVYGVYDLDDGGQPDLDNLALIEQGLSLLEDSWLGGSGSRGYGSVTFDDLRYTARTADDYRSRGTASDETRDRDEMTLDEIRELFEDV
ncbi:type III-A CRISPR-associated RAMP protein Csm3 [Halocatena salina]|uniref:CRISPR system Cms endoribonuclease Csm3 n=1 Tax=Halocatena salina TaxID=2934340 RepID=A0A8U0A107_9EURY|nr:type III-A CRISPR-associated RAMP protein Csm3 [Halocatena salina]UPM42479.1 type III-A CRISPR-associated RAMP protein Csm3 [Halocatena salina]